MSESVIKRRAESKTVSKNPYMHLLQSGPSPKLFGALLI